MTSLSDVKQAKIIEAFKSTSRYPDDLLNIDNPYFFFSFFSRLSFIHIFPTYKHGIWCA